MALHNANEITKINDELMALRTGLEFMRGEFDDSALDIQTAVMSIFGALYGKQLDDIKYGYDLEDKNNKVIKNGINYAANIKAQKNEPRYRNALTRYLNTQGQQQVAAPAIGLASGNGEEKEIFCLEKVHREQGLPKV